MTKTLSPHAECAKAIRKELKENFPLEKFKVRSETFSMGNAVRVYIGGKLPRVNDLEIDQNSPEYILRKRVEKIVNKYQYGHFDGMNDSYEYSNRRDDLPQVKWVSISCLDYAC